MLEREMKIGKGAWEEFASLIGILSLERCSREICNPFTGEQGWRAPKDRAFRISGHFIIYSEQSSVENMSMPLQSVDILKEKHPKKYKEFLEEAEGNEKEALGLLVDDLFEGLYPDTPISFFDGKWLVISPDLKHDFQANEKGKLKTPEIKIKGNIRAWSERNFVQIIDDIAPQSSTITGVLFERQARAIMHWGQDYAEAVLGKCKIELVDFPEEEVGRFTSEPADNGHLYLPEGRRGKGIYSEHEFAIKTRKRPGKREEEQLRTFNKNSGLSFSQPWDSDLLIAQRVKKVILSEKKKKERKSQNIPF